MSDITAAQAGAISGIKLPGLGDIGAFFSWRYRARHRRADDTRSADFAAALIATRFFAGHLDHLFGADPDDGVVYSHAA
ncbi:MAG: hypothetical protein WCB22_10950 [Pseudolabrys sp.]